MTEQRQVSIATLARSPVRGGTRGWVIAVSMWAALASGCSDSDDNPNSSFGSSAPLPLPSQVSRQEYQEKIYAFLGDRQYRSARLEAGQAHPRYRPLPKRHILRHPSGGARLLLAGGHELAGRRPQGTDPGWRHDHQGDVSTAGRSLRGGAGVGPSDTDVDGDDAGRLRPRRRLVLDLLRQQSEALRSSRCRRRRTRDDFPFAYPDSDFGSYCVRCHASADGEMTFSTTENIEGFHGEPIEYEVDDSWIDDPDGPGEDPHPNDERPPVQGAAPPPAADFVNHDWLALYDQLPLADRASIETIPPVTTDRVPADGHTEFVTSDQCESCHSGDTSSVRPEHDRRRHRRLAVRRMALVDDGAGRPRSDLLRAAREREGSARQARHPDERRPDRELLPALPWRDGAAPVHHRPSGRAVHRGQGVRLRAKATRCARTAVWPATASRAWRAIGPRTTRRCR